jgi:hypothetical protein
MNSPFGQSRNSANAALGRALVVNRAFEWSVNNTPPEDCRVKPNLPGGRRVKPTVLAFLVLSLLTCAAFAESNDINGWQDAKWGMTPDEVQKAVGQPMSFADLAKVCDETCKEGAALELGDYALNDQHFIVRLWFTKPDIHLRTVSMYAKKIDGSIGSDSFSKMKNFLENAYGTAQSVALRRGYFTVTWKLPSTIINLYSNTTDEMTIVYEQRTDKEPEKQ